ncbi:MAG: hypothetical protein AAGK93_00515 [Pseudomonadota bacterium]
MNDQIKGMTEKRDENILISPEGVEERIEKTMTFQVTLTQGGKYRLYMNLGDERNPDPKLYDSMEEAEKGLWGGMMMMGALKTDPEATLKAMLKKR